MFVVLLCNFGDWDKSTFLCEYLMILKWSYIAIRTRYTVIEHDYVGKELNPIHRCPLFGV